MLEKLNSAADALTRNPKTKKIFGQVSSISLQDNLLEKLHKDLGCPGITKLFHQVKIRNLPYSLTDVTLGNDFTVSDFIAFEITAK